MSGVRCRTAGRIGVAIAALAFAQPATAQYFGRNKVRYDAPAFRVLATDHFDVHYYPAERLPAEQAARLAERWYARLSTFFNHELRGRQPLILYASPAAFRQTNIVEGELGEGTGGVTESLRRRIVLPLAGSMAATDHVIGHELVHAFQFDLTARAQPSSEERMAGAQQLPLWFVEGMAEYLSLGPADAQTAMWLRDALTHEALPPVERLGDPRYFPYRWGHALWAYVAGRWGEHALVAALRQAGRSGSASSALAATLGITVQELTREWHAAIRQTCGPVLAKARPADTWARAALAARRPSELNVGPALSPDGRLLAYLSEKDLLSVDLFVSEVATGRMVAKVASTARDAHLGSLNYVASAGAWDPAGQRLAYAARRGSAATIELYDVAARRPLPPLRVSGIEEILTPAWSPDGRHIAFAGMRDGVVDVFVITVDSGEVRRLTDDAFADLHPLWARDGASIVVATDRFTTVPATGRAGYFQLARIGLDGVVETLVDPWPGHMLNPQWADPDGTQLLVIGDRGGAPNLWRIDLVTRRVERVTALPTGVAGITALSPALSTAPAAGRVAFSTLDDRGHRVFVAGTDQLPAPSPLDPAMTASELAPASRGPSEVAAYLADGAGLPDPARVFDDAPYRPRLGLDAVIQPSVGVAVDRFGSYAGGQVALLWDDMLGDRSLVTAFQASTTLDADFSYRDLGGVLSYSDRTRRWNWTATAEQSPYRTGYVQGAVGRVDGQPAYVEQEVVVRQTVQAVSGVASYPFDAARRLELGAGAQRYTFSERTRTIATALDTRREILDQRTDVPGLSGLALGRTMAAWVYDRTSFGATSPVFGERYRLEVSPTAGTIRYTGLLADYRRYFMPVPFYTLAGRVLHYGRYGSGGEDERLSPLFLGYPELVRGYDLGSFRAEECELAGCEVFDRLVGSRLLVTNAELRFPLLRPFGAGREMYGPVPIELAIFGDAGVTWSRSSSPAFAGGGRDWATSAGASVRVNVFGLAVVQLSLVRPFQRPGRGWMFQFSLTPGF